MTTIALNHNYVYDTKSFAGIWMSLNYGHDDEKSTYVSWPTICA